MDIVDDLGDPEFTAGQQADAEKLGDRPQKTPDGKFVPAWDDTFLKTLDGVFLLTGDCQPTIDIRTAILNSLFLDCIKVIETLKANVRHGAEKGHEQ